MAPCIPPDDFPTECGHVGIAGAQPKMGLIEDCGRFRDQSSDECLRADQYQACEELATRLADFCFALISGGNAQTPAESMSHGLDLLRSKRWCSDAQNIWIMRRVAQIQEWEPLKVEAGTATWVECDVLPSWMDPVGPPVPQTLSGVEQLALSHQQFQKGGDGK